MSEFTEQFISPKDNKKVKIYFCFLNEEKEVELDEEGNELYYRNVYENKSVAQSIKEFHKEFEEVSNKPEIVEIIEEE